jgi:hypothetical protein
MASAFPRHILTTIRDKDRGNEAPSAWDLASAAEACVALGEIPQAALYLARYVRASGADAFELGSTLRQFTELLKLDNGGIERHALVELLRAELLKREGGRFETAADTLPNNRETGRFLEKIP